MIDNPEFAECADCAAKPGSPTLCRACLHNRATINQLRAEHEELTKVYVLAARHEPARGTPGGKQGMPEEKLAVVEKERDAALAIIRKVNPDARHRAEIEWREQDRLAADGCASMLATQLCNTQEALRQQRALTADAEHNRDSWKARAEKAERGLADERIAWRDEKSAMLLAGGEYQRLYAMTCHERDQAAAQEREQIASWLDDQFNGRDDDPHNLIADVITALRSNHLPKVPA